MKPVTLKKLIEALDIQNDELYAYLDRDTGEIVMISEETTSLAESTDQDPEILEWQREEFEVARRIAQQDSRYVALPGAFEVHEWEIMLRFCDTRDDARLRERLLHAIHGRGAFRRFKEEVERASLWSAWHAFKECALREHATAWCEDNDISFRDEEGTDGATAPGR